MEQLIENFEQNWIAILTIMAFVGFVIATTIKEEKKVFLTQNF